MIEKLIAKSRITEVHGTSRTMNTAYESSGLTTDQFLTGIYEQLISKTTALGMAISRSHAESVAAEKDEVRDDKIRAVGYQLQGYLYSPEQAVRDAAAIAKQVFDKYGFAIIEETYVSESSHIISMLNDFAAPKVVEAITLLKGVSENIAALKAAQDDFETTRAKYAEEEAKHGTLTSATVLKKEVLNIINNDLVQFLRTGERFQPEIYGAFARTIAEIIDKNNEQVKKRSKKDKIENEVS
ncbi:DUF6261 family protein [Labilibacter marinus]|uniref:DUF6261 family protein n=1 Tax=Labilibacter marinus TaxID=1477105 RepID=UPI000832B622|nr:DUF6261 family protein [Labilibacter marinus]